MENVILHLQKLLSIYNTSCPFKLAELKGFHIIFEELGSICGYYNSDSRIKMIHINQNMNEFKQKFTCAHELYHAIEHEVNTHFLKKFTFVSTDKFETEANIFAINLLFHDCSDSNLSIEDAIYKFGIPKEYISPDYLYKKYLPTYKHL